MSQELLQYISPVATGGLSLPKQSSKPPKLKHETLSRFSFWQFLKCQAPTQIQNPPTGDGSAIQYICFRKTSVSNMGAPNLLLATGRAGLRGGQRGQLPRAPRWKGAPRDEVYLFQIKYSFEKFSDSEAIQEYNSILYSYVALSIKGPQQELISLQVWLSLPDLVIAIE